MGTRLEDADETAESKQPKRVSQLINSAFDFLDLEDLSDEVDTEKSDPSPPERPNRKQDGLQNGYIDASNKFQHDITGFKLQNRVKDDLGNKTVDHSEKNNGNEKPKSTTIDYLHATETGTHGIVQNASPRGYDNEDGVYATPVDWTPRYLTTVPKSPHHGKESHTADSEKSYFSVDNSDTGLQASDSDMNSHCYKPKRTAVDKRDEQHADGHQNKPPGNAASVYFVSECMQDSSGNNDISPMAMSSSWSHTVDSKEYEDVGGDPGRALSEGDAASACSDDYVPRLRNSLCSPELAKSFPEQVPLQSGVQSVNDPNSDASRNLSKKPVAKPRLSKANRASKTNSESREKTNVPSCSTVSSPEGASVPKIDNCPEVTPGVIADESDFYEEVQMNMSSKLKDLKTQQMLGNANSDDKGDNKGSINKTPETSTGGGDYTPSPASRKRNTAEKDTGESQKCSSRRQSLNQKDDTNGNCDTVDSYQEAVIATNKENQSDSKRLELLDEENKPYVNVPEIFSTVSVGPATERTQSPSLSEPELTPASPQRSIQGSPRLRDRDRSGLTDSPRQSEDSDDDDDAGIYAESHRYSRWKFVGSDENIYEAVNVMNNASKDNDAKPAGEDKNNGHIFKSTEENSSKTTEKNSSVCNEASDHSSESSGRMSDILKLNMRNSDRDSTGSACGSEDSDGVFTDRERSDSDLTQELKGSLGSDEVSTSFGSDSVDADNNGLFRPGHNRTPSTSTTASEVEFRGKYRAKTTRTVQRKSSTVTYQRFSERYFDQERKVVLEKGPGNKGFGFHIQGSCPVIISAVDAGTPAEKAGLKIGDVLISVVDINVVQATHQEVVGLMSNCSTLRLEVAEGRLVTEMPLCSGYLMKQGGTGLLKNWRRRWFVLKQDHCLYYYKTETDKDPLGAIHLTNYTISKAPEVNRKNAFKAAKYGQRTYYFSADSEEDMSRWAEVMIAAATPSNKGDTWLDVSSHNVGLPALSIKKPDCHGTLNKMGNRRKHWKRRYCVLKDACLYYYLDVTSSTAQGVAHLHGYSIQHSLPFNKKFGFMLTPPEPRMRTFFFYADNETDMKRWVDALQRSIGRWVRADDDAPND